MRLTVEQIRDLADRVEPLENDEQVEVSDSSKDGRIQFYMVEVKEVLRPLRKAGNHKDPVSE
jgi:hypothetical protein